MVGTIQEGMILRNDEATLIGGGQILYSEVGGGESLTRHRPGNRNVNVNGVTPIVVNDERVNDDTIIAFSLKAAVGTVGHLPRITVPPTRDSKSFTVIADVGDISLYNYFIF
jgi:hypothetical protein